MKKLYLKGILLCLCLLAGNKASAYVEIGGIYYDLSGNEAIVTSGSNAYSGSVVIPASVKYDGKTFNVTGIGDRAFIEDYYDGGLASVTIPEGVKTIGDYAFYDCYYTNIKIPKSITSIGSNAFGWCYNLTSVTLPICEAIGDYAFCACSGLTSISFSENLTYIGSNAFYRTPWYNNQPDGLVYAGKFAYQYKGTMPEGTEIAIEDGTVGIVASAFYNCSGLTSITIPESVKSIGGGAFYGTTWYNNQPDGLVYAGKVAYKYKGNMPSNTRIRLEEGTLGIAGEAFYNCDGLAVINIPGSVTNIGDNAFGDCGGLTSVSIPNSVTSIGQYAFYYCYNLNSILIPESVTSIGYNAFARCSGLNSIMVSEGNPQYDSRNGCEAIIETATNKLVAGCAYTTIPNSVESIGENAFCYCYNLTNITIPTSVTSIGRNAFYNCRGLRNITIPGNVTSIGDYAFEDCSNLATVIISKGVKNIGMYAFGWTGLTDVEIPASVKNIGSGVFAYCSLTSIKVDGANENYDSRDGCNAIINKKTNSLIAGCNNSTIPEGVKSIGDYAFGGCKGLTSLHLPKDVTSIGSSAFSDCSRLSSINIPSNVTSIGSTAFYNCSLLTSITIPNGVKSIGEYNQEIEGETNVEIIPVSA